jgi:hypothetical protein
MLPSFGGETLEQIYQGFPLIYRFEVVWMDEFVFKPRKSCKVKGRNNPACHAPNPGHSVATRMIRQLNIEQTL